MKIIVRRAFVMKRHSLSLTLLSITAAILVISLPQTEVRGAENDGQLKGTNKTGCVEVIEAKNGAPSCAAGDSISIRLKVNCDQAIDIRVYYKADYKGKKGWQAKTFLDKKQGDEITLSECGASGPYMIAKRKAGSEDPFATPQ